MEFKYQEFAPECECALVEPLQTNDGSGLMLIG
jgi:hypothetical protein